MQWWQYLSLQRLLHLLELRLAKLALRAGREQHQVGPFSVRHRLEIAEIDHDNGTAGYHHGNDHFAGILVPAGPTAAAEVVYFRLGPGSREGVGAIEIKTGRDSRGTERDGGFGKGAETGGGSGLGAAREEGGERRSRSVEKIHR